MKKAYSTTIENSFSVFFSKRTKNRLCEVASCFLSFFLPACITHQTSKTKLRSMSKFSCFFFAVCLITFSAPKGKKKELIKIYDFVNVNLFLQ